MDFRELLVDSFGKARARNILEHGIDFASCVAVFIFVLKIFKVFFQPVLPLLDG